MKSATVVVTHVSFVMYIIKIKIYKKKYKTMISRLEDKLHYCYVYGGKRNLNFHGWLNNTTIKSLENEGCTVEVRDYEYQKSDDEL